MIRVWVRIQDYQLLVILGRTVGGYAGPSRDGPRLHFRLSYCRKGTCI